MVSRETHLSSFADALFEANERTNLVSRKLTREQLREMVGAFAQTFTALDLEPASALLDIGTGAGLPGIPLAIATPGLSAVLVESRKLRVAWLNDIVSEMELDDVTVIGGRVQDYPELEGAFPRVTAFGVGPPADTIALVARYLCSGGVAVLSAPAEPQKVDESQWLLAAAMASCRCRHHPNALAGGRALVTVHHDP